MRIVILNLPADVDGDAVRRLVGPGAAALAIGLHPIPLTEQACAVVRLDSDWKGAWDIAQRIGRSQVRGARLASWVPTMAWG